MLDYVWKRISYSQRYFFTDGYCLFDMVGNKERLIKRVFIHSAEEVQMIRKYAKYMKSGKHVESSWTGDIFVLVQDMNEDNEFFLAVNMSNWERYKLLTTWERNWEQNSIGFRDRFTENIEDCAEERKIYEEKLKISDVMPYDKIRFITSGYETLFEVRDLENILVNGKAHKVAYLDETHFTFVGKSINLYAGCLHIRQFAEICERNGHKVEKINRMAV
jgi:hypothetical protein